MHIHTTTRCRLLVQAALACALVCTATGTGAAAPASAPPAATVRAAPVLAEVLPWAWALSLFGAPPDEPGWDPSPTGTPAGSNTLPVPAAEGSDDPVTAPDPVAAPTAVEIPAIGVDASLVELGLAADRSMEVPDFGLAGWYVEGPAPGDPGPAVIAAHVDSYRGPDVFHRLRDLQPGDEVIVRHADGSASRFAIDHLEQAPKDELPGDRIWAPTDERVLRLITCGGTFDRSTGHYVDNVIAYASAVDPVPIAGGASG